MSSRAVLELRGLHKRFGAVHAVDDVSLSVDRGEVFGFLGPNGAGKTTTISMALGLTHASAGSVEVLGQPVTPARNEALRRVGTMVGAPALMPGLSARENVACLANLFPGLPRERVGEALEQVGLADVASRRAGTFSAGMKQRLGLALALLGEPELLVLDEPATGLDPAGIRELRVLFKKLADRGVTVFLSSHQLHEVELICDRVAVIHRGRIIAQGTVEELTARSAERVAVVAADRDGAVRVLRGLPGARDVEADGRRVTVAGVASEVVVYNLVQQGVTPREVTIERPSLEALFLQLTGAAD